MERVLILGASGLVGKALSREINERYDVYGTYNNNKLDSINSIYYDMDFVDIGNIEIDDNFKVETGQKLTGKVVATDALNFTHEYLIMHYVAGEKEQHRNYYENEKIIAPNGTVIYNLDESELY